ncbi:peptidoglycan-associated lipoprotein Pal [Fluviispira multicolorata]|uniref:Peptidoglycan-associated lipoprotein n=1 Tax=Fluviispira multicolorata TaxID=2654512 RepID=A0A833JA74_9BACT|nr:peptidoglycan-associated lipoprotein Pal [Fluviispira multicolorata]KAB8027409.1 peptidoglycan-associated lipoprotein Pal [Fluviispira multicolorata]
MKFSKVFLVSSVLISAFSLASCSSTKKSDGPSKASEPSAPASPVETHNPNSSANLKTIYFDFNKYDIRGDQKETANKMAESLKANTSTSIRIEGHTDDRGSAEYNMALGQKRAKSLENYLKANGVSNSIETISYGKERPAMQGENESAWAKNRRDEVVNVK